jgi:hypothetical protein
MASSRLRQPAFGRRLRWRRNGGRHPASVYVVYGESWRELPADAPCLCVGPDYNHRMYDWSVVAGLPVTVIWRSGHRLRRLLAELVRYSPRVAVTTPRGWRYDVLDFLYTRPRRRRHPLWPESLERDYRLREHVWELEQVAHLSPELKAMHRAAFGELYPDLRPDNGR